MLEIMDYVGIIASFVGTYLLSFKGGSKQCRLFVFILFLISNTMMAIAFTVRGMYPYSILQASFAISSIIGIKNNIGSKEPNSGNIKEI